MATVHLLNVKPGDCTIIQHNSGRNTWIDICDGNLPQQPWRAAHSPTKTGATGNFRMCKAPTNPIAYAADLGITSVWRFILTHPDMDHMDGFDALVDAIKPVCYWDTGSRREKPDFLLESAYREEDWDRYESVRDGGEGVQSVIRRAADRFAFANQNSPEGDDHDGLYILAPNAALVADCNMSDDVNDGSYVILYRSRGGRILLPGDAHDNTWGYIRQNYASQVQNCSFLLAPHHGRDSDRSYDFLDLVRPQLTLIGCAPSEYIDYQQWSRRNLDYITSNQCGNVVLETIKPDQGDEFLAVYIENHDFARCRGALDFTNSQGYAFLTTISPIAE